MALAPGRALRTERAEPAAEVRHGVEPRPRGRVLEGGGAGVRLRHEGARGAGPDGDGDGGGGAGQFALPTAATCFNTLRLPEYPTYEALEQHVTVALRHGVEGFSFG
jgi:hypothetical protein